MNGEMAGIHSFMRLEGMSHVLTGSGKNRVNLHIDSAVRGEELHGNLREVFEK